jgi:acyl-CoA synthetase (AMP-forming)/AMP-acid ligase II
VRGLSMLNTDEVTFRSPYPDVAIPDSSFDQFLLARAREFGDRPALIEGPSGRSISYAQLAEDVRHVAAGLSERGFRQRDVFAIFCPNVPEYATTFLAVSSLGGINTTINPLYTVDELAFQLNDAGARYLLTVPAFVDKAFEAVKMSKVEQVFVLGPAAAGTIPFSALLGSRAEPPRITINPAEDVVALPYSSGTTGLPKGVMLTHRNLVSNICQFDAVCQIRSDDRILAVLPLYHIYGLVVVMADGLYRGAAVVTLPRFELEGFLQTVQDQHISVACLVPPIILALAKHPLVDRYNLSRLRMVVSGAAPLGADLERECAERVGCLVRQGYGLTETSPVTHCSASLDALEVRPGSVGPVIPNTECKIAEPVTGEALGPRREGEVWIRGPQVMKGYLNNPEATAQMLRPGGWLRTGDLGYVDEHGLLYLVDRIKELIKYKGFQVAPAELEAVLLRHPAVADAAVIPVPDEEAGEIPKGFVVLKPGAAATHDKLTQFVARNVAPYKKIRRLEVLEQIPKSASGKILRRVLVERERAIQQVPV